jgi:hypothetical protein
VALADRFAAIFAHRDARARLAQLGGHTNLSTFNLATTSLRHTPKWFDRLEEIAAGVVRPHGNFLSDPATVGLVKTAGSRPVLTAAGTALNRLPSSIKSDRKKGEYELIKTLYYRRLPHRISVTRFLNAKRRNLLQMLNQFVPTPNRRLFVQEPSLLVIAELLTDFPGAVRGLLGLSQADLLALAALGEDGFATFCRGPRFPVGLNRLCRRIGGDYRRGQERRLNYIVSMALCEIASVAPVAGAVDLTIPPPFSLFLTEVDVHSLHAEYTNDLTVWFDGDDFFVSKSLVSAPVGAPIAGTRIIMQLSTPRRRRGSASATSAGRRGQRGGSRATTVIIDPRVGEHAEDWIESQYLRPKYGNALVRAGHRTGETMPLPDGFVPGADFYIVTTSGDPNEFIEIKSISGPPPADISLTRAEYRRALQCLGNGTPYSLILVDVVNNHFYQVDNFVDELRQATLETVLRFTLRIG